MIDLRRRKLENQKIRKPGKAKAVGGKARESLCLESSILCPCIKEAES
jgi:hypothetical protein